MKRGKGFDWENENNLYDSNSNGNDSYEEKEIKTSNKFPNVNNNKNKNSYKEKMNNLKNRIRSNDPIINPKMNTNLNENTDFENNRLNMNSISNASESIKLNFIDEESNSNMQQNSSIKSSQYSINKNSIIKNDIKEDNIEDFNINQDFSSIYSKNNSLKDNKNSFFSHMKSELQIISDSTGNSRLNDIHSNSYDSQHNNYNYSNFNLLNSLQNNSVSTKISINQNTKDSKSVISSIFNNVSKSHVDNNSNCSPKQYNNNNYNYMDDYSIISNPLASLNINDETFENIISEHLQKHHLKIDKPYDYQIKIFKEIKDKNSIVFMETGKGKTFISIMLIRYLLDKELNKMKIPNFKNPNSLTSGNEDILNSSNQTNKDINKLGNLRAKIFKMAQEKKQQTVSTSIEIDGKKFKTKVFFLVCEVVLVDQQSKVIENNLDNQHKVKVAIMNSSKKFSRISSSKDSFKKFWDENTIFVSTPSIVYKLLSIGYINIEEITLVVFDECHHTDGYHPYNLLMNEFYFFHKERNEGIKLPQILGLTASPLKKKIDKDVISIGQKALENLCENLDSVMVIDPDVLEYGNLTKSEEDDILMLSENEAKRIYKVIVNHKQVENYKILRDFMLENLFFPIFEYSYDQEFLLNEEYLSTKELYKNYLIKKFESENLTEYNKILSLMKDLYEYRKKHFLFALMEKLQRQVFMLIENLNFDSVLNLIEKYYQMFKNEDFLIQNDLKFVSKINPQNMNDQANKLIKDDICKLKSIFENFLDVQKRKKIEYTSQRLNQLLADIEDVIEKDIQFGRDHRVIIFVSNRVVSEMLSNLINKFLDKIFNNKNNVKNYQSVSIVGVNKRKNENSFNPSNSINKMNENVSKFKKGEAQILVGTSTVEEGIDVRKCDYVIVYTELKTAKSYIQMKGRARKAGAIFCIYTDNVKKMQETISDFVELILFIRNKFNKKSIVNDFRKNVIENKFLLSEDEGEFFYIETSKAKVTIRNSSILFNEFMQSLQLLDKKAKTEIKYHEKKMPHLNSCPSYWNCDFCLRSILIDEIRFTADYKSDKNNALNSCYVMLFLYLYEIGKLDDSFKYKK